MRKLFLLLPLILLSGCCGYIQEWIAEDIAIVGPEIMANVGPIEVVHHPNVFLLGWTEVNHRERNPIKIRCRCWLERLYFFTWNEREVVIHEIMHSYQLNTVGYSDEDTVEEGMLQWKGKQ